MADFLHCNNCLKTVTNGPNTWFLTECQKVFCGQCLDTNTKNCVKCAPNKCRVIQLKDNMSSDIKLFFKDITSSFQSLQKVETFQKSQRNNLISKLMTENKRLLEEHKRLEEENGRQKQMIDNLENELKMIKSCDQNRRQSNPFDKLFGENKINGNQTNGSVFGDLFSKEAQKENVFGHTTNQQMNINAIDYPMNDILSSVASTPIHPKSTTNPLMFGHKKLSPLKSIRRSKISIRSPIKSMHSNNSVLTTSQQSKAHPFSLPPMKSGDILFNQMKNIPPKAPSNSSDSMRTPINNNKRFPSETSMTLSSLYRNSYSRR